ncbi:MAG: di-trans,poly-cis-decaprenylcistransferase [Candidatus Sumerlaeia bacterium]|nr:di-trans,poly-cis-decaprenylcistransferase [Candidatus Sumerlaeia bacterium]
MGSADLATLAPAELLAKIDRGRLPRHVAVIMDGNGRWARRRGFRDRIRGHESAIDAVRDTVTASAELGLTALTLYSFSKENWRRPRAEISALMGLLDRFLLEERPTMLDNSVRLVASGDTADLPDAVQARLRETMELTRHCPGLVLNLALSYGGRQEIVRAARALAGKVRRGEMQEAEITEASFERHLFHPELPHPDLMIRTSGEMRLSNFLLWQLAYAEFVVMPVLWPDFRRADLYRALIEFQGRERRFGGVLRA